ncbi:anhydro-N-acetylmuramic acid kinase [Pedobacter yulinensis]|uniref:Anhydro-N-acetylmuramic acid kinase n=1 Tax=Pedobacter yulinensis TaxID=2126353 RepID=A0A2T3HNF2_9SPHI|nr:anhydro-N-acetylmuramic acid kinase [Pedobacter yulinensis]PST83982.1 anhydro-N-acetylmuramic acid kinase [Pedobacter yulinensis]
MNKNWKQTFDIAEKPQRKILGLMSGTSLDGLDIALCVLEGSGRKTRARVSHFKTVPYTAEWRAAVKAIFSKRDADLQQVCLLNEQTGILHAEMILSALKEWGLQPEDVDLIASHGQTIFHAPRSLHGMPAYPNATLQIGDGDHIAMRTGIITLSDFRQKHLAAGGEGAPLAVYGDYLVFSKAGENRIMLNIGGIANFTFLPADEEASRVFSTDVGPGNTLMDQYMQQQFGRHYDEDGKVAGKGMANEQLLAALLDHSFFGAGLPKTTGPELFNLAYLEAAQLKTGTTGLSPEDVMATLSHFSARSIADAIKATGENELKIFMSGGGMHNNVLTSRLQAELPGASFFTTADLGIDPDAKEALLFAILANETMAGEPQPFSAGSGIPPVCMGKVSFPF